MLAVGDDSRDPRRERQQPQSNVASTPQVTVYLERSTVTLPFAGDPVNPQITAAPAVQR